MNQTLLEKILQISRRMAEMRELDPLLRYTIREAMMLVNARYGYLILQSEGDHQELEYRVALDKDGNDVENAPEVSLTIVQDVIRTREYVHSINAQDDPRYKKSASIIEIGLRSVLCVPLIAKGACIGAIFVENREHTAVIRIEDSIPLTVFANQAAVIIENARINENLENLVAERTSELHAALQEQERQWKALIQDNQVRTSFLADLAHDVRNSLSVAMGAVALVLDELDDGTHQQMTHLLRTSIDSMKHTESLTTKIFNMVQMPPDADPQMVEDTLTTADELVNLDELLEKMYQTGLLVPWKNDVTFHKEVPPQLPSIMVDGAILRQILINLITNAMSFTKHGKVTLYAAVMADEQTLLLGVRDTGIGLSPEDQQRIFQRFYQVDNELQRCRQGYGLGLAICREIIEKNGGKIWVESEPGRGSDFKFTLPINGIVDTATPEA